MLLLSLLIILLLLLLLLLLCFSRSLSSLFLLLSLSTQLIKPSSTCGFFPLKGVFPCCCHQVLAHRGMLGVCKLKKYCTRPAPCEKCPEITSVMIWCYKLYWLDFCNSSVSSPFVPKCVSLSIFTLIWSVYLWCVSLRKVNEQLVRVCLWDTGSHKRPLFTKETELRAISIW